MVDFQVIGESRVENRILLPCTFFVSDLPGLLSNYPVLTHENGGRITSLATPTPNGTIISSPPGTPASQITEEKCKTLSCWLWLVPLVHSLPANPGQPKIINVRHFCWEPVCSSWGLLTAHLLLEDSLEGSLYMLLLTQEIFPDTSPDLICQNLVGPSLWIQFLTTVQP